MLKVFSLQRDKPLGGFILLVILGYMNLFQRQNYWSQENVVEISKRLLIQLLEKTDYKYKSKEQRRIIIFNMKMIKDQRRQFLEDSMCNWEQTVLRTRATLQNEIRAIGAITPVEEDEEETASLNITL